MATLTNALYPGCEHTAVIVPSQSDPLIVSYDRLATLVASFQANLASLGITPQSAVSIALPNSLEFAVAFLATASQRAIAAPLNPAYKREEFEFYIDDLSSVLVLVPKGSFEQDGAAVRAARKYQAAIAECFWDGRRAELILDVKDEGKLQGKGNQKLVRAQPDDIALVLHTSGTTGRPKAVGFTLFNVFIR